MANSLLSHPCTLLRTLLLRDHFSSLPPSLRVCRVLLLGAYSYLGVLLVLLALENYFLFPVSHARHWSPPPPYLSIQDLELLSSQGNRIHACWCVPSGWTPSKGAILYSHGNGGNLSLRWASIERWQRETDQAVLIYDYPGYGRSSGKPTEQGCYAACEAAFDWLLHSQEVAPDNVILLGSSLGAAMAVDLASRQKCRLLLLLAPFTSFPDMAQKTFPFLPARWLVRNQLNNLQKISSVHSPVFIAHGTADTLVPHWMGEKLYQAAPEPKRFLSLPGHPHVHPHQPEFYTAVRAFLQQTRRD